MNENKMVKDEEIEINLQRIFNTIWDRLWVVILVGILGAAIAFGATRLFVTPMYQSSAMFYVNNSSLSVGDTSFSISSSDITASKSLVESYIVILNTRETLNDVIDYAGVQYSYKDLRDMISAESVQETEIFRVTVTGPNPEEADDIADAIAYILPNRISDIIEGTSAKIVDSAVVSSVPSSPSYPKNIAIGCLLGILLTIAVIVLRDVFDITIREEADISRGCSYPILAAVPNMTTESKGGYYYSAYGGKQSKKTHKIRSNAKDDTVFVGKKISFIASEAYKLLRTKLQFSFTDDRNCRVIGISSALAGEGKSLTSVNLAYTLSQLDKRVLLVDCDMRKPSLNAKLPIKKIPGLSGVLSGQADWRDLLQPCGIDGEEESFAVIAAGRNPPNPVELLSSAKMAKVLAQMREVFDYIILDLPPVTEVSDAMAVAKETDGMLLVVRQDYCNHVALSGAVREFEFVNAKILGVVYNCTVDQIAGYGKKYYKRYYRRYYGKYVGKYSYAGTRHNVEAEAKSAEEGVKNG